MLIWDFLFLALVIAPIVTGGVWFHAPGFHVEYTQPGIAAVALCLIFYWLGKKHPHTVAKSKIRTLGLALWAHWRSCLKQNPKSTLLISWLSVSLLWFLTSLFRHRALGSGLADLGIFTNGIWNFSQLGFPFSSLKEGQSLFADHQIFLLYPLSWIFPLWPRPEFLLLLQALGLSSGAVALYLLGRQRLGSDHPVVPWLPFLFWMCGPLRAANLFDFHPEVLMLPLFLFAIYFLQEAPLKSRAFGAFLFLCALGAKESAGPVACGIGLAWILGSGIERTRNFTRAIGGFAVALGLFVFYFDSAVVPGIFHVKYAYGDLYAPLGSSVKELALAPFTHTAEFFGRLLSISRIKFLFGILLPLGFLPLLAPRAFVAALPGLLMLFLTSGDHRISLGFHYAIEPMVGLMLALLPALASARAIRAGKVLLPALMLTSLLSYGRSEVYFWRVYQPNAHVAWLRNEVLPFIPQERSVSASYGLVPQLSTRHWVNQIPYYYDEKKALVDCALIDDAVNNTPLSSSAIEVARTGLAHENYVKEFECRSFSLYRRADGPSCISQPLNCRELL